MRIMNQNEFSTQSLSLAAALNAVAVSKLETIDFHTTDRATFIFDRSKDPSFDEIVARFWSHQLPIDAATYFDSLRYIKSRMHEER
jgi:hypothetical protein